MLEKKRAFAAEMVHGSQWTPCWLGPGLWSLRRWGCGWSGSSSSGHAWPSNGELGSCDFIWPFHMDNFNYKVWLNWECGRFVNTTYRPNWYGTWQRFPISLQQIWHASLALAHQEVLSRARRVSQRIQGFLEPLGEQKRTLLRNWEFRPLESGTYLCSVDAQLHHTYCISDSNQT